MKLIDLSHEIGNGTITYPGLPGPVISDHLSWGASHEVYAAGVEFQIGRIDMVANTGTYLDTPAPEPTTDPGQPTTSGRRTSLRSTQHPSPG